MQYEGMLRDLRRKTSKKEKKAFYEFRGGQTGIVRLD
jgi:hypothetical protein